MSSGSKGRGSPKKQQRVETSGVGPAPERVETSAGDIEAVVSAAPEIVPAEAEVAALERVEAEVEVIAPAPEQVESAAEVETVAPAPVGVEAIEPAAAEMVAAEAQAAEPAPDRVEEEPADDEPPSPVNYDEPGLFETVREEGLYRFDAGKQGTALCLSLRAEGSWRWRYLGELRWDGRDLRSRALDRRLLDGLSKELRKFAEEAAE